MGVNVRVKLCQRKLDEKEMQNEWQANVLAPIFKGKVNVRNCNTYREAKLLEHAIKIVERVLERRIWELVNISTNCL